jgi:DNA (cytosine-5)-methyltransferase 1
VAEHIAHDWYNQWQRPVAIDLFCGAGGLSCGLTQAGFDVIAAADSDTDAAMTYMINLGAHPCQFHFVTPTDESRMEYAIGQAWKRKGRLEQACVSGSGWISHQQPTLRGCEHFFFGDASKLTGRQILNAIGMERGEVDLVAGSPPCQGFSYAGKREVMDPRNSLVFDFARLICEIQPKAMCFENVPGIVSMVTPEGVPVMDAFARILEDGGMGGYDALRNLLARHPEARAIVRSKKRAKIAESELEEEQQSLFHSE